MNAFGTGTPARQRGLTFWGWLYVAGTMGLMLLVGIKCVPIYMNNYEVRTALQWAASQPELRDASVFEIRSRIQRRFDSGYVSEIRGRDIQVSRVQKGRQLSVEYRVIEPLFGNLSMVFDFHEQAFLPGESG